MPKPRADRKLDKLPEHLKQMLKSWFLDDNMSYKKAKEKLYLDFNVETSVGALSDFYHERCFEKRFEQAASFADLVAEQLATGGVDKFDEATIALVKQKAFERAVARDGNLKELGQLAGIINDSAKLNLKREELQLSLAKFREATKTAIEKGLDALYTEIKDKPAALELFERLKAAVMDSVDGKETAQ